MKVWQWVVVASTSAAMLWGLPMMVTAQADDQFPARLSLSTAGGSPGLPLDDRAYEFLERCAARGWVPLDLLTNRPIARSPAAKLLDDAAAKIEAGGDPLLIQDLHYFQREFAADAPVSRAVRSDSAALSGSAIQPSWHVAAWKLDDGSTFVFDPRFTYRVDVGRAKTFTRRASGIQFRGSFRRRLGYRFIFSDNTERGGGPYTLRTQLLEDHYGYVGPLRGGKETYYDQTDAAVSVATGWGEATFGKESVRWGPGRRENLLLSGAGPSFDHLRLKLHLTGSAQFTYLVGRLHPSSNEPRDTAYVTSDGWKRLTLEPKWLAAHRLEYAPRRWLLLSISEAVIWGERGLDVAYLNPLYFLYSAQHDGGDRDNVLMSGDFVIRLSRTGYSYGALLIDDLNTSQLGKGDAANKTGWLAGLWVARMGVQGMEVGVEYLRLEPFVYSHFFPINRYSTWTSSLGASLPPNSDRLEGTLLFRRSRVLTFTAQVGYNRHGRIGGEVEETQAPGGAGKVHFLDGDPQDWWSWRLSARWEPIAGLAVEAGLLRGERRTLVADRWYVSAGYRL